MARLGLVAGPRGPAGSAFVPVGVLVYSEADLPAPVGGVITLVAGTVYQIMAHVTITAGRRIEMPADAAIAGLLPASCQILGDVDAPLIRVIAPTSGSGHIEGVRVENSNAGTSARAVELASAVGVMTISDCYLKGARGALLATAIASVKVLGTTLASTAAAANAVSLLSASALVFEYCSTAPAGLGGTHVALLAGATIGNLSILRHGLTMGDVTQVGIFADPTAAISGRAVIERVLRFGAAGAVASGWNQGTPRWSALAVDTLPDSTAVGGSYVATPPFTVVVGASATWYPIAPAVGTPWALESDSERFSLVSAANGQMRYVGTALRRFLVVGSATLSKSGTTRAAQLGIFVNGSLHAPTVLTADVTTRAESRSTAPCIVVLNPNDTIDVRVLNTENADDFDVAGASISAIGAIVS